MTTVPRTIEHVRQSFDAERSKRYRQREEEIVRSSDTVRHYGTILRELSESLTPGATALDVGCGSGRYFHCLRNVRRLVGIDLSPDMLEQARAPVCADEMTVADIELLCDDVQALPLPEAAFDLIYSIGVYGEYSPLDDLLLRRLASLLKPGAVLFITAVDSHSRVSGPESGQPSLPRKLLRKAFPLLPGKARERINRLLSPHYLSRVEMQAVFERSPFRSFAIEPYRHVSGWPGTHWDCRAIC